MMLKFVNLCVLWNFAVMGIDAGRILAVFPGPSISHQFVFRPFTQELARRGHEVVVITTDPAFPKGQAPTNLTEIDVHDISYSVYRKIFSRILTGKSDMSLQLNALVEASSEVFKVQLQSEVIQELINDKKQRFDLVITEAYFGVSVVFSYIFKAPAILLSSFGFGLNTADVMGSPIHPLYPSTIRQRINNLSTWEEISAVYSEISYPMMINYYRKIENNLIKQYIPEAPTMVDLFNNVQMLLLNVHSIWEWNRPIPPGVIFLGSLLHKPKTELTEDLQSYLDSSKNGVIYVSFGTNVIESLLPTEQINMFLKVFSQLPYDVVWKWGSSNVPNAANNIRFFKWVPQPDLLKHPKLKLFITQGGLQSTDEAIAAGVPLIGIPMSLDQWFNVEHYVSNKIGLKLSFETITEEELRSAIDTVAKDDSYRSNVVYLRSLMHDQPQRPLERAVWWTEHVLRHGGAQHLRAPAANMGWAEYLELELVLILLTSFIIMFCLLMVIFLKLVQSLKDFVINM